MPGDRKHHTDKWRRCVDEVMGRGHDESSSSAICTTSLQNAGEEIYAEAHEPDAITVLASSECRDLHLLGATGPVRYDTLNGRKHLVVPIVALIPGVIHPVNADSPELVTAAVLEKAAASWRYKPVTMGHPKKNGTQCSASEPDVRKAAGIGVIMKSDFNGKKLLQEAWIDEEKAKQLDPKMYEALAAGDRVEVSVGAFCVTAPNKGRFNGRDYKAEWLETQGDHVAILYGGRGACSVSAGCGTHRAATHFVAAKSIELLPEALPTLAFTTLEGKSFDDRISAVNKAVNDRWPGGSVMSNAPDYGYVIQTFDDHVIVRKSDDYWDLPYAVGMDGTVTLGEGKKVKQVWVAAAAKYADCETCDGTGQVKKGDKQEDCPTCHGEGKLKTAAGARHSSGDMKMIQTVHDHATALGATCDRKNLETASGGDVNILIDGKVIATATVGQVVTTAAAAIQPQLRVAIKREGTKWVLYSTDGTRRLALHDTEAEAVEQQQAINRTLAAKCG